MSWKLGAGLTGNPLSGNNRGKGTADDGSSGAALFRYRLQNDNRPVGSKTGFWALHEFRLNVTFVATHSLCSFLANSAPARN